MKIRKKEQNQIVKNLSDQELEYISYILNKNYTSGQIIEHKFYRHWGTSVILENNNYKYTEAHAGSGEIAVVKLVHKLLNLKNSSLILLDEPEVSLHPGAQIRLKIFLLEQILNKKHQVVISTHSPSFVENLPKKAIKLFTQNPTNNQVEILDECTTNEAFYSIGQTSINKFNLLVEDKLAQKLVNKVLETMGEGLKDSFSLQYHPGGESTIKKEYIKHYAMEENQNSFVLLDGDQNPQLPIPHIDSFSKQDLTVSNLSTIIKRFTNCTIEFFKDGNQQSKKRDDQVIKAQLRYLEYYKNKVFYLPLNTPEEIIWDETYILQIIPDKKYESKIKEANTFKLKIKEATLAIYDDLTENNVDALENMLIKRWLTKKYNPEKEKIEQILQSIVEKETTFDLSLTS